MSQLIKTLDLDKTKEKKKGRWIWDPNNPPKAGETLVLCGYENDHKIAAIKLIRILTGMSLKEAKDFVERVEQSGPKKFSVVGGVQAFATDKVNIQYED